MVESLELLYQAKGSFVLLIRGVLPPDACRGLTRAAEGEGMRKARQWSDGRHNSEAFIQHSNHLVSSDVHQLIQTGIRREETLFQVCRSRPIEIYRYSRGDYIDGHHDATWHDESVELQMTVSGIVYLNDDYRGGATTFSEIGIDAHGQIGDCLLFSHDLFHSGEKIQAGTKYIWRFDAAALATSAER